MAYCYMVRFTRFKVVAPNHWLPGISLRINEMNTMHKGQWIKDSRKNIKICTHLFVLVLSLK